MKFKLLLLATMPIAMYAQDTESVAVITNEELPNTFTSGSAKVEKFTNSSKRFNDWAISVGVGPAFIAHGDLVSFYDKKVNWGWNAYVSLDKQISHTFGISLQYQTGKTHQQGKLPGVWGNLAGVASANTKFHQISVLGDVNLSNMLRRVDNRSKYRWALHAYAGMGLQSYDTYLLDNYESALPTGPGDDQIIVNQNLDFASFFYQGGLGLKYKVSKFMDVEARAMYIITGDDEFDGGGYGFFHQKPQSAYNRINSSRSDNMMTFNLGASFKIGKHDSHLTWHDPLQELYGKVHVLENTSKDFTVCEKGDQDNDGVCDDWDRQLDTPAGARVDGAGVALDLDLDGVIDLYDECVTVPGPVENRGCPYTKQPITDISTKALEGIEFDLDKYVIRPKSYSKLNTAAEVIKSAESNAQFKVIGATDDRGSHEYNQKLSEKRANSVVNYLINKGVKRNKLTPEGRGKRDLKYPECVPASKCPEWKNEANRRVFFESK